MVAVGVAVVVVVGVAVVVAVGVGVVVWVGVVVGVGVGVVVGMKQMPLRFGGDRIELVASHWSWVDHGVPQSRWFGPRCIDTGWPWFRYDRFPT